MTAGRIAETVNEDAGAIEVLKAQHNQIKALFGAVESASGEVRQREFDHLRALLAVHETAEEEVLRPVTRSAVNNGEAIADSRIHEENEAKEVLANLEKMGVDSPEFLPKFLEFKESVLEHATHEEEQEFPGVQQAKTHDELVEMAKRIKIAERMAPTHPHPSAKTTEANYLMGPFDAMLDRVRDRMKSKRS